MTFKAWRGKYNTHRKGGEHVQLIKRRIQMSKSSRSKSEKKERGPTGSQNWARGAGKSYLHYPRPGALREQKPDIEKKEEKIKVRGKGRKSKGAIPGKRPPSRNDKSGPGTSITRKKEFKKHVQKKK